MAEANASAIFGLDFSLDCKRVFLFLNSNTSEKLAIKKIRLLRKEKPYLI